MQVHHNRYITIESASTTSTGSNDIIMFSCITDKISIGAEHVDCIRASQSNQCQPAQGLKRTRPLCWHYTISMYGMTNNSTLLQIFITLCLNKTCMSIHYVRYVKLDHYYILHSYAQAHVNRNYFVRNKGNGSLVVYGDLVRL